MRRNPLESLPTLSAEKKRVWTPIVSALTSVGAGSFLKAIPTGPWGYILGSAWLAVGVVAIIVINRPGRYARKALEVQLKLLIDYLALPRRSKARFTIWAPKVRSQKDLLEQVTNYLPDGRTGLGRSIEASKGIVGRAFRERKEKVIVLNREEFRTHESIVAFHVTTGFDPEEAARLMPNRRAYLAVPIVDVDNTILGVIYGDSSMANAFGADVLASVVAIAPFFRQLLMLEGD